MHVFRFPHVDCLTCSAVLPSCSPLGSGTVQFKMAGEILVKPHEQPKTGYKAPNAYGARPIFSDET